MSTDTYTIAIVDEGKVDVQDVGGGDDETLTLQTIYTITVVDTGDTG